MGGGGAVGLGGFPPRKVKQKKMRDFRDFIGWDGFEMEVLQCLYVYVCVT